MTDKPCHTCKRCVLDKALCMAVRKGRYLNLDEWLDDDAPDWCPLRKVHTSVETKERYLSIGEFSDGISFAIFDDRDGTNTEITVHRSEMEHILDRLKGYR